MPWPTVCICGVFADRMIAEQPLKDVEPICGTGAPPHPYPQCNCTSGSVLLSPKSPSLRWAGAMSVKCPYYYYSHPENEYPLHTPCGVWISFPKAGLCKGMARPDSGGDGECTWRPDPFVRVVYGADLLRAGMSPAPCSGLPTR